VILVALIASGKSNKNKTNYMSVDVVQFSEILTGYMSQTLDKKSF